jgi:hypothetical protein
MSDFLQRLVERHATPPSVRPRTASRFELPAASGTSSGGPADIADAFGMAARADDTPGHETDAPGSAGALGVRREAQRQGTARQTHSATPGASSDQPARGLDQRSGTPGRLVQPVSPGGGADEPHLPASSRVRVEVRHDADGVSTSARLATPRGGGTDGTSRQPSIITPAVRPPEPGRTPSARHDGRSGTHPSREPDIVRVHIGRVEVRAIVAPAERPRPAAAGPNAPRPLSLDGYLAGKRRP